MMRSPGEPEKKPRIVILISGSGSNMVAIADAIKAGEIDAEIAAVICNRPNAAGLQKARDRDIEALALDHKDFPDREHFDVALMRKIDEYEADLIVLAGFMRILTADFVRRYEGKMLNIHPSLLPKYTGLNTHQRAIDAGDAEHGVTVHFVTKDLDEGPNVVQASVVIDENDDAEKLRQRVQQREHIIYPIAVKWFISGRLTMKNKQALLDGKTLPPSGLLLEH